MRSTQSQILDIWPSRRVYWILVGFSCLFYLAMTTHIPLSIMLWQSYDDNLFIKLGQSLAQGKWLGRFNELTLIKGPGYPIFLAMNAWLGLPLSLSHAIFYCIALVALSLFVLKVSKSHLLAFAVFFVPLWHPQLFEVGRVVRDMIYASQAILFLALFSYCVFIADLRSRAAWSIVSGLLLGWFWLTREEGVWILPGIALIVIYSVLTHKALSWQRTIKPTLLMLVGFCLFQATFSLGNWIVYGSFVSVDVKEKNFQAALSGMESVRVGEPIAYVSVPREVRNRIYEVSPSFAKLRPYLDPQTTPSPWMAGGCMYHKETCGEIGTGFYMWALREAAGKAGYYGSPTAAAGFFGAIAADIENACRDNVLRCQKNPIPYMPPATPAQLKKIPGTMLHLIETVAIPIHPNARLWDITGAKSDFDRTLKFLNYPHHYPLQNDSLAPVKLAGWYYDRALPDSWFQINVVDKNGVGVPFLLSRDDSPDMVTTFVEDKAGRQRFTLLATCSVGCKFIFTAGQGATQEFLLDNNLDIVHRFFPLGNGTLAFDTAEAPVAGSGVAIQTVVASRLIPLLYSAYKYFLPALLGAGVITFFYACYLAVRRQIYPIILGIAGACWAAILARAGILVLLDISSFPGVTTIYLYPIFSMSTIAACLSIGSVFMFQKILKHPLNG